MAIPALTSFGVLPCGVHDCTFADVRARFSTSDHRKELWAKLDDFVAWIRPFGFFTSISIDGSYITDKEAPGDIDVVIEFGSTALPASVDKNALDPAYIRAKYGLHAFFHIEGVPNAPDLRAFFQYVRPEEAIVRGLQPGESKGILRVLL